MKSDIQESTGKIACATKKPTDRISCAADLRHGTLRFALERLRALDFPGQPQDEPKDLQTGREAAPKAA